MSTLIRGSISCIARSGDMMIMKSMEDIVLWSMVGKDDRDMHVFMLIKVDPYVK